IKQILDTLKERAIFHPKGVRAPQFTFFSNVLKGFKAVSRSQQTIPASHATQEIQPAEPELKECVEAQQNVLTEEKPIFALGLFIQEALQQLTTLKNSYTEENPLAIKIANLEEVRIILTTLIPYLGRSEFPSLASKYDEFEIFVKEKKEAFIQQLL